MCVWGGCLIGQKMPCPACHLGSHVRSGSSHGTAPTDRGGVGLEHVVLPHASKVEDPQVFAKNTLTMTAEDFPAITVLCLPGFCLILSVCWLTEFYCLSSLAKFEIISVSKFNVICSSLHYFPGSEVLAHAK